MLEFRQPFNCYSETGGSISSLHKRRQTPRSISERQKISLYRFFVWIYIGQKLEKTIILCECCASFTSAGNESHMKAYTSTLGRCLLLGFPQAANKKGLHQALKCGRRKRRIPYPRLLRGYIPCPQKIYMRCIFSDIGGKFNVSLQM